MKSSRLLVIVFLAIQYGMLLINHAEALNITGEVIREYEKQIASVRKAVGKSIDNVFETASSAEKALVDRLDEGVAKVNKVVDNKLKIIIQGINNALSLGLDPSKCMEQLIEIEKLRPQYVNPIEECVNKSREQIYAITDKTFVSLTDLVDKFGNIPEQIQNCKMDMVCLKKLQTKIVQLSGQQQGEATKVAWRFTNVIKQLIQEPYSCINLVVSGLKIAVDPLAQNVNQCISDLILGS